MPPKPKPKKGEDDLIDLKDLPKSNYILAKTQYDFCSLANRDIVSQLLKAHDHPLIRPITLAESKDAGLRRGAIPEEPPEGTDITTVQLAKSIAAKIYEVLANTMSEKDLRIKAVKAKEEALKEQEASSTKKEEKTKSPAKKSEAPKEKKQELKKGQKIDVSQFEKYNFFPNENELDVVITLDDIPMSEELIKALADEGYAINAIYEIKEKIAVMEATHKEESEPKKEENEEPKAEPTEEEKKAKEEELKHKAEKDKADKEKLDKERDSNKELLSTFKKLAIQSKPTSPLRMCNLISVTYSQSTGKVEGEEEKKDPNSEFLKEYISKLCEYGKQYVLYQTTKNKIIKVCFGNPLDIPAPKPPVAEEENKPKYDTLAVCPYEEYKVAHYDDEIAQPFDKSYMEMMFNQILPEKIESMLYLSLCIDQLLRKSNQYIKKEIDESEKIANLFAQYEANKQNKQVVKQEPLVVSPKQDPKYNIVHSANNQLWTQFFNQSEHISHINRILSMIKKLIVPGITRNLMPEIPIHSAELRGAIASEIMPFFQCTRQELERFLLIMEFEKMFKEKYSANEWNFGNRIYEEELNNEELMQRLEDIIAFESDFVYSYNERTDSLLLGAYYHTPKGRILRRKRSLPTKNWPNFNRFITFLKCNPNYLQNSFWDVDDNKVSEIHERIKIMYPSDGSLIKISKLSIANNVVPIVTVNKDQYTFGMVSSLVDATGTFWLNLENNNKIRVEMVNKGACLTYTLSNNSIIKILPNADILLIKSDEYRVITGKGVVIKYLKNGKKEVLFPNGNFAEYYNGYIVTTNNKGNRRKKNATEEIEADSIPCAHRTDAETLAKIMVRDDDVTSVKYVDGRLYTLHKDGTKMLTSANEDEISVRCPGFVEVKIHVDRIKARAKQVIAKGSADALMGSDNIMARSNDGKVSTVFLPDKTTIETFRETQETDNKDLFTQNTISLIRRVDLSIIKVKEDGEVVIVTANQRAALNAIGQKKELGKDVDYFFELFGSPDERKPGVYTCRCALNEIMMCDDEGNRYIVYGNGTTAEKISISFNLDQKERPQTPMFEGDEYVEEACKFFPEPKIAIEPRLFTIRNDGTGFEILQNSVYEHYLRTMKLAGAHITKAMNIVSVVQEIGEQRYIDSFQSIKLPKIVDIAESTPLVQQEPPVKYYTHRKIEQKTPLTDREKYLASYKKYCDWVEEKKQRSSKFCIKDTRPKEEQAESARIQALIYQQRKSKEKASDIDEDGMLLNEYFKDKDQTDEIKDPLIELLKKQGNLKGPRVYKPILAKIANDNLNTLSASGAQPLSRESKEKTKKQPKPKNTTTTYEATTNYFSSHNGKEFLVNNPIDPGQDEKRQISLQNSLKKNEQPPEEKKQQEAKNDDDHDKSNPIVVLETDAPRKKQKSPPKITPSAYSKTIKQMEETEHEKFLQSEQYHISKTKEFSITGKPREEKPFVQTIARPDVSKDLNQKYIMIDMLTDKRVKTCSMSNRILIKAPDVEILRKKGQHQMVESAIKKRQTYEELMMENNAMIEYTLSDPSKRNLLISPPSVRFGTLKINVIYQTKITVKNEDVMPQRIFIKNPKLFKIKNKRPGPIAQGINTDVVVIAEGKKEGALEDEIEIISKSEIFKIKVSANIVSAEKYEEMNQESLRVMNRPLKLGHVIEKPKEEERAKEEKVNASIKLNPEKTLEEMAEAKISQNNE